MRIHRPPLTIAGAALLVGVLLSVAWIEEADRRESFAGRRPELARLVTERQARAADLEGQIAQLRADLAALAVPGAPALGAARREIEILRSQAGLTMLRGQGVVVVLADSPFADRNDPADDDFRIQDVDLQQVVNALWAAGAEAISINGERLTSGSAIRGAGRSVLVNYRVLTSPYRVAALGTSDDLRRGIESSNVAANFRKWAGTFRLGFDVSVAERLVVPALKGVATLRYAMPAD